MEIILRDENTGRIKKQQNYINKKGMRSASLFLFNTPKMKFKHLKYIWKFLKPSCFIKAYKVKLSCI